MLDELDAGLQARVGELGERLADALDAMAERHGAVFCRRGRGLMQGLVIPGHAATAVSGLFDAGVLACTAAGDVLRFLPPYVLTDDDLELGLERVDGVLSTLPSLV